MNIDRATPADVQAIAHIHVNAWRAAYKHILSADYLASLSVEQREVMWQKTIESGQPELLVARISGTVCGWVSFAACRDEDAQASQGEVWAIGPKAWVVRCGLGRERSCARKGSQRAVSGSSRRTRRPSASLARSALLQTVGSRSISSLGVSSFRKFATAAELTCQINNHDPAFKTDFGLTVYEHPTISRK